MNFSFDWGAVIVAGLGAAGSILVMKSDMRWIKESIDKLEAGLGQAHGRIDRLVERGYGERHSDFHREAS